MTTSWLVVAPVALPQFGLDAPMEEPGLKSQP